MNEDKIMSRIESENCRPVQAHCDTTYLNVVLSDARILRVPLGWYPKLLAIDHERRNIVEILPMGIHWPAIDEDISIASMLRGEKPPQSANSGTSIFGRPLFFTHDVRASSEEERVEMALANGAYCPIDYRSLIHKKLSDSHIGFLPQIEGFDYDSLFAATDALLDVHNILHVAETHAWPKDETLGYLWMYGVLQVLAVEQHRAQGSLTRFNIGTYQNYKNFVSRSFDVRELITKQRVAIEMSLSKVWNLIESDPKYASLQRKSGTN